MQLVERRSQLEQSHRGSARQAAPWALGLPLAAMIVLLAAEDARAVDGCLVLLCLAAPSWKAIPECVGPMHQLFHDLERGKPFPVCEMSGAGNSAVNTWTSAPTFCPQQYTRILEGENGPVYSCDYGGCVSVSIDGGLFTRTWWNFGGDTSTEYTPSAKLTLGSWDTRFDDDLARWLAASPTPLPGEDR